MLELRTISEDMPSLSTRPTRKGGRRTVFAGDGDKTSIFVADRVAGAWYRGKGVDKDLHNDIIARETSSDDSVAFQSYQSRCQEGALIVVFLWNHSS